MGASHLQHVGRIQRGSSVIQSPYPFGDFVCQCGWCNLIRVRESLGESYRTLRTGKYENHVHIRGYLHSSSSDSGVATFSIKIDTPHSLHHVRRRRFVSPSTTLIGRVFLHRSITLVLTKSTLSAQSTRPQYGQFIMMLPGSLTRTTSHPPAGSSRTKRFRSARRMRRCRPRGRFHRFGWESRGPHRDGPP